MPCRRQHIDNSIRIVCVCVRVWQLVPFVLILIVSGSKVIIIFLRTVGEIVQTIGFSADFLTSITHRHTYSAQRNISSSGVCLQLKIDLVSETIRSIVHLKNQSTCSNYVADVSICGAV